MAKIIVLMGGQGVGKGTFSAMLRAAADYNYIETGALFRALPADSEIGRLIAAGNLVPDEKLFELVASKIDDKKNILVDGFPRTLPQARWFVENYADKFNIKILYLNVPEEIMLARIHKRRHVDGAGRADDADMAAVRRRLDTFRNVTMPAIEWLSGAAGIDFRDVDVSGELHDNFARILRSLKMNSK
ncbi:MAG: nucleoside monophosphate kinase [Rickettsiales bacterium]|nr:nucleoside monophosphate kinase [Rickettsiales bacterium]